MIDFGMVQPGRTLYIPFDSFDGGTGASITLTGLAVTDIEVYKDGSVTQRASDAGYTLLDTDGIDFDAVTGIHGFSINLADNTTAGFWAAGSQYFVVVSSVTIDAQTVSFIAARFTIGQPAALLNTTIATLSTQTSFTLTDGPAEDDALNGMWAIIHDVASAVQWSRVQILDYTGSTKTVTLVAGASFTVAATDNISIMGAAPLQPVTTGRTLEVDTSGIADADVRQWLGTAAATPTVAGVPEVDVTHFNGAVGTFASGRPEVNTSHVAGTAQTAGDIIGDTNDIQARLPAALVGGRIDSSVGAMAANVVTAAAIADAAIDRATFAAETGLQPIRSNTAQAGAAGTMTLDASASAVDDFYNDAFVFITGGTGVGQCRLISDYVGATKVASVVPNWATNPDATSTFAVLPQARVDLALWLGTAVSALISGRVDANAQVVGTGAIVSGSFGAAAIDAAALAADAVDEFWDEAMVELSQAIPSATPTMRALLALLYMTARNAITVTSTTKTFSNDAGTVIAKKALSDDGTTYTEAEAVAGP